MEEKGLVLFFVFFRFLYVFVFVCFSWRFGIWKF